MSDSRTAGGLDRLPWLTDEPARKPAPSTRRPRDLLPWAAASVLVVAGASFWLGSRSGEVPPYPAPASRSATVSVPEPRPVQPQVRIAPQPQIAPTPTPQVREVPEPQVRIAPPPVRKVVIHQIVREVVTVAPKKEEAPATSAKEAAPGASAPASATARAAQLRPWPPRVVAGASGRLVQIGAYGSRIQAKHGWGKMVAAYPAVAHLPAVVVETRNSHGRLFYRFQIGTTSQAHSEVLCQRMQKIALSCAVVGLPWKAKVER
jgi:outer membrane biosynthesis protein TonB